MPQKCPQCGASLPMGVLAGLCPACLMQQGAATDTATRPEAKPFVPLTVEEVARLFPQLEILGFLGKGGMGAVYKARQAALDRLVALKILPAQTAPDPGFAERFTREARALARLSHPNIVAVYEFGQVTPSGAAVPPASPPGVPPVAVPPAGETPAPLPPAALPYFIMEFVDGVNLRQLQRAGRLSPREALQIVPQICDALQYAHDEGVVHRDIKPENVLVDRKGRVKIADFGLAKIMTGRAGSPLPAADSESETGAQGTARPTTPPHLTEVGQVMGTPHYMAPEQVERPQDVDHRADIYSLGVVFYEMLTGELPLGKFQPPSRKVEVDVRLDEVVLHALEKEPDRRYQHASEVKTAIESIAQAPSRPVAAAALPQWYRGLDYRTKTTLFGLPLLHVTSGADPATGKVRVAKGIIAIGGIAKGVVAVGGVAMGGFAFGGLAMGVFAYGGLALGLLAFGGGALALIAGIGGGVIAPIALGGGAIGYFAHGGVGVGVHVLDSLRRDPAAERFFLPWAQALFHHFQLINGITVATIIGIGVGVPRWLEWRQARANADAEHGRSPGRAWKIAAAVIFAVVVLNCVIVVIALRPALSKPQFDLAATKTLRTVKSGGPFLAHLPQGTIELVAVSRHPSTNEPWWKPDGSPTKDGPFDAMQGSVHAEGGIAREFLIRLIGLPEDVSEPVWKCDSAASMAAGGWPYKSGQSANDLRQAAIAFSPPAIITTLKFGFGWGQWETLVNEPANATTHAHGLGKDGHSWNVICAPPSKENGSAVFTVSHSIQEWETRIIAVDKAGGEHFTRASSVGSGQFTQLSGTFSQLPLSEVKEFRFQARPYRWVEFRNVSLEPGLRTQVEVVDAAGASADAYASASSKSSAGPQGAGKLTSGASESSSLPTPEPLVTQLETTASTTNPATCLQFRWVAEDGDTHTPADGFVSTDGPGRQTQLRVLKNILMDGSDVASAGLPVSQSKRTEILLSLTTDGRRKFAQLTAANIGRQLAIIWRGRVLSAPFIRSAITSGELTISGNMTDAESEELSEALNHREPSATPPNSGSTPQVQAAARAQLTEPPTLRFLAWQDVWQTNQPSAARHPDGSRVTDPIELGWLRQVLPGRSGISGNKPKSEPRYLHLWFSYPPVGRTELNEVSLLDGAGKPIQSGTRGAWFSQPHDPSDRNDNLGWFTATLSEWDWTNLPSHVTVWLTYTVGPLERIQEFAITPNRAVSMFLGGGGSLNNYGQNMDGTAFLTITADVVGNRGRRFDAVAVTKEGREIPSKVRGNNAWLGTHGTRRFEFTLPLADVAKFLIGTRPIRTNEWRDVVLPGN